MIKVDQIAILCFMLILFFTIYVMLEYQNDKYDECIKRQLKKLREISQERKKMLEEQQEYWKKIYADENYIKIMKLCERSEGKLELCFKDEIYGPYWYLLVYNDNDEVISSLGSIGGDLTGIMYHLEFALGKQNIEKLTM